MDDLYLERIQGYMDELVRCKIEDCDFYLEHNAAAEFCDYIESLLHYQVVVKMNLDNVGEKIVEEMERRKNDKI